MSLPVQGQQGHNSKVEELQQKVIDLQGKLDRQKQLVKEHKGAITEGPDGKGVVVEASSLIDSKVNGI